MNYWLNIFKFRDSHFDQKAFGMIEALAVIVLVGVVGLGLTKNMNDNMRSSQQYRIKEAVESLVRSQLEIYSMVNPNSLENETHTETALTYPGLDTRYKFDRETDIEADGSIVTITVKVTSKHKLFPLKFNGSVNFAKW